MLLSALGERFGVSCMRFVFIITYILYDKVVKLAGGGSVINGSTLSSYLLADPGKARVCSTNTVVIKFINALTYPYPPQCFTAPPSPNGQQYLFQLYDRLFCTGFGHSKSKRSSKSCFWFKSYRGFAVWVDFAYWCN